MRLATVRLAGETRFGAVVDDGFVDLTSRLQCRDIPELYEKGMLAAAQRHVAEARPDRPLGAFEFLPVISRPEARVFALGWAYKDHQVETGKEAPAFPNMFSKHPQSLVGHEQALVKPPESDQLDYEGEIVIVIGKAGRRIPPARAREFIAGFTIMMDGSVRDWQKHSVTAGKNFDASSSCGPWLVTQDEIPDPQRMVLTTRLNGAKMQHSGFDLMAWDLGYLVNYVSTFCRLQPGDAISTGTPGGVGARRTPPVFMKAGDLIEVDVTGIGTLRNRIVDEDMQDATIR
jgi:2-keto-4-pentenoate hydratase/2-oxohepta-3-ene-1,7-dioic acid hydratase in catechol pathway